MRTFASHLKNKATLTKSSGEVAEWSIAAVLKTVVPRGTRGSNPCLSAINAENQQIAKQTPNFTPKNVKLGVFVLFKPLVLCFGYRNVFFLRIVYFGTFNPEIL